MGSGFLQVASTFTATPIKNSLRAAVVETGVAEDVGFVLYGQISEYLLRPAAARPEVAGTVVLLRLEDWLRDELKSLEADTPADPSVRQQLSSRTDEFVTQLAAFAKQSRQVWVLVCPSTGWIVTRHKLTTLCRTHTNVLLARVRKLPVTLLDCPAFLSSGRIDDPSADRLGHMPYLPEGFDQLGQYLASEIVRTIRHVDTVPAKPLPGGSAELAAFLAGLHVQVKLSAPGTEGRVHVDRLLRTAAGFSLTGENPNIEDAEVDRLFESHECFLVSVSDRLSDYGPSGFVFFQKTRGGLLVDSMALSCIVLGKQVEFALLSALARHAVDSHLDKVVFEYNPSGRNGPIHAFLQGVAEKESETRYLVPVAELEARIQALAVSPGTWNIKFEPSLDHPGVLS